MRLAAEFIRPPRRPRRKVNSSQGVFQFTRSGDGGRPPCERSEPGGESFLEGRPRPRGWRRRVPPSLNSSFQGARGLEAVFVRGKPRRTGYFALEAPNLLRARPPPIGLVSRARQLTYSLDHDSRQSRKTRTLLEAMRAAPQNGVRVSATCDLTHCS